MPPTDNKDQVAMRFCDYLRSLYKGIDTKKRAIEYQRERLGIKGRIIADRITGGRTPDHLESAIVDTLETLERLEAEKEALEAEYLDAMKAIERMDKVDQGLLLHRFILCDDTTPLERTAAKKPIDTAEMVAQASRIVAPYHAVSRLFDYLPRDWIIRHYKPKEKGQPLTPRETERP